MKLKLVKPIIHQVEGKDVELKELDIDYNNIIGTDIFEVEKEMVMLGHPIGTQFIQSPKALATLAIKAAGLPTYLADNIGAQDIMKLISITAGFLMGVPTVLESPIK